MQSLLKRAYSPALFDSLFAAAGILAFVGIALTAGRSYPAIAPASQPLTKGVVVIGVIVMAGIAAVLSTRHDQKHADDFLFHVLTKSAFIAMFTAFFALAAWQALFVTRFGGVSPHATIGVLIASWSLSYFYTRAQGTGL